MAGPSPCLTACRLAKRFNPSHKICRLWSKTPSGPALRVTHSSLQNHVVLSSEKIHITPRSLMVALKQWRRSHAHTIEWRCNALKYFKILHRSLQEVTYNINHMLLVEKKALTGHLWGVLNYCVITPPHCICVSKVAHNYLTLSFLAKSLAKNFDNECCAYCQLGP